MVFPDEIELTNEIFSKTKKQEDEIKINFVPFMTEGFDFGAKDSLQKKNHFVRVYWKIAVFETEDRDVDGAEDKDDDLEELNKSFAGTTI